MSCHLGANDLIEVPLSVVTVTNATMRDAPTLTTSHRRVQSHEVVCGALRPFPTAAPGNRNIGAGLLNATMSNESPARKHQHLRARQPYIYIQIRKTMRVYSGKSKPGIHLTLKGGVRMVRLFATLAICLFSVVSAAEEMSWACSYSDRGVQVEFSARGKPTIEEGPPGMDPFVLVLNTDEGTARIRGNSTVEVVPILSGPTLSFLERTPTGINLITLFIVTNLDEKGTIPFAQARHLDLVGPFPQAYYGTCIPLG